MTNKEFVDSIKENQNSRSNQAVDDLRKACKAAGANTSAYNSPIDPHSAALLLYAFVMAPSTRKSAAEWINGSLAVFEKKEQRGEVTPIEILLSLFEDPDSAAVVDRVVIHTDTGDLYAVPTKEYIQELKRKHGIKGDVNPDEFIQRAYYDLESEAQSRAGTLIQNLVQITGDYFRLFHEVRTKLN